VGDIPFIGKLFQHRVTTLTNTDLIIEITPRVVNFEETDIEYNIDKRLTRKLLTGQNTEEETDQAEK